MRHDLFNALAWMAYPRAKAMINAQHAAILEERGEEEAKRRGPERDALTLFDEGGVAVLSTIPRCCSSSSTSSGRRSSGSAARSSSAPCGSMLSGTRSSKRRSTRISDGREDRLPRRELDDRRGRRAGVLTFRTARASPPRGIMAPMPVLGVPGWHEGTAREDFY
jgi:hypothetical protein